ncbi:2Fe-2S iron-sulfur cluster-binding protein [Microbacterium sp. B19]|uniref:2Fe-2S iron-sulfur cluster-binding protein n=1 Tax=Microbacterium sp. B19 TaxID=96765 RepID=UPI000349FBD0|nr:2Fe-2S iron-sulfur cluster-binding protein [Microbacterium sp. B19]
MIPEATHTSHIVVTINGRPESVEVDNRMSLLDLLRERLDLIGSKKGCDHGQCGACTLLIDGRRELGCLTLAVAAEGRDVTTVEGLADAGDLHPVQRAFIERDAFQCGYCTPGQICSAVGVLDEAAKGWPSRVTADVAAPTGPAGAELDAAEVRERMSGNLCRCAAYSNIVAAVLDAR